MCFLLLIIPLCMGYGENSWLMNVLHIEFLVRFVYALFLSIPFAFFGFRRWVVAAIALITAFQIHAGSLGHISWFGDILIEDILRYGTLGVLISFNIFLNKET